jgi:hypothetical protein
MSEIKLSLLDKRIAQFFESTTELLTGIHARNKDTSNKERRMKKTISIPKRDIDILDEEPSGS